MRLSKSPQLETFQYKGWKFISSKKHISNEQELKSLDLLRDGTVIDKLPDAFFGSNSLELHYNPYIYQNEIISTHNETVLTCSQCYWSIKFSSVDALLGMRLKQHLNSSQNYVLEYIPSSVQVVHATTWKKKHNEIFNAATKPYRKIDSLQANYDWTYTSSYWGTIEKHGFHQHQIFVEKTEIDQTHSNIPKDFVTNTTLPILWSQHCDLFSDDLADTGFHITDVKIRVMNKFWFLLYRQFIHINNVLIRQNDVRVFHEFGTNLVLREFLSKERLYNRCLDQDGFINLDFKDLIDSDIIFKCNQKLVLDSPYEKHNKNNYFALYSN